MTLPTDLITLAAAKVVPVVVERASTLHPTHPSSGLLAVLAALVQHAAENTDIDEEFLRDWLQASVDAAGTTYADVH